MTTNEIQIERVDEKAAQRLADATGRVTYMAYGNIFPDLVRRMTTDRDEAVVWGQSVAFVPNRPHCHYDAPEVTGPFLREKVMAAGAVFGAYENPKPRMEILGEQQAGDHYEPVRWTKGNDPDVWPEPQLRVVRVLEYRGPQFWVETTLAHSHVSPTEPFRTPSARHGTGEIVEQIRTTERLCRHCGGEHLGSLSEDECSANPRKGKY